MNDFFRTMKAFLIRDATTAVSYRLDFALRNLSIVVTVGGLYFASLLVGDNPKFAEYGGFLPFAVTGSAMLGFSQTAFRGISTAIRTEQMMGTLEAVLMTPARISTVVVSASVWSFLQAVVTIVIFLLAACLFLDIPMNGNPLLAILVVLLTTAVSSSWGVIAASFIMIFKRGDPVGFLIGTVGMFLGGVFFPVSELPAPLQAVSYMLPITHGNMAFREIMLQGKPLADVAAQIYVLLAFTAFFIPLSLFCFRKAVNRAQREGTLVQY